MKMESFTAEEVQKHSKPDSLWIINNGKVFDVTDFAGRHPGGMEALTQEGGKDATAIMQSVHSHKHSKTAYQILEKYQIGLLHCSENGKNHEEDHYEGVVTRSKAKRRKLKVRKCVTSVQFC